MSVSINNAASMLRQRIDILSAHIAHLYRDRKPVFVALVLSLIGTIATARAAWNDYKLYLSYGPGGLPYNVGGWMISNSLRFIGINPYDTKKVDGNTDKRVWLGEDWPKKRRAGGRPRVGPHPIPSRQLDQHTTAEMQKVRSIPSQDAPLMLDAYQSDMSLPHPLQKFLDEFSSLAKQNSDLVEVKQSQLENHTDAMFVLPDNTRFPLEGVKRELAHIHGTSEYSAHVVLSPQDCKKVIESGWGELHMLSGVDLVRRLVGVKIPDSYTLIYAPRDDGELETALNIVRAAMGYMTDSRDVK